MKYEPVYGNQDLFDGASKDAVIAIKRPFISGVRSEEMYFFSSTFDAVIKAGSSFNFNNVILKMDEYAERRIIAEPKRWTVADQKAGLFPEVGCIVEYFNNNEHANTEITAQWRNGDELEILRHQNKNKAFVVFNKRTEQSSNLIINCMKPIEAPEEKAQREESEFVMSLMLTSVHSGTSDEYFMQGARAAYRKLKGGE